MARSPCRQHNLHQDRPAVEMPACLVRQTTHRTPWNRPRRRIHEQHECSSDEAVLSDGLLPDEALSDEERVFLGEYLTPRRGLNGALLWPLDELDGGAS